MSVEIIELYSESSFRFRPVGAVEYISVPGGRTEVVEVEHGTSLEVSSTNDNSTIRISGNIQKIDIIESKLTDLSNMIANSRLSTLIISSESKIETVSKMISRSIVSDIQINADMSDASGKDDMVMLSVVDNDNPIDGISSFGNSIVSTIKPTGYISGLENALTVDGDSLDLRNTLNLENLSGENISAFNAFGVTRCRDQDIVPAVYNRVHDKADENYTFEMDIKCNAGSSTMNRENIEYTVDFDDTVDSSMTFEMDIKCNTGSSTMNRDIFGAIPFEFNSDADTANYTFEMDIINPYTES